MICTLYIEIQVNFKFNRISNVLQIALYCNILNKHHQHKRVNSQQGIETFLGNVKVS